MFNIMPGASSPGYLYINIFYICGSHYHLVDPVYQRSEYSDGTNR